MMVEQKFIDKIEDLRHHTYSRITELQRNLCPMVRNVYMNYQFEYWYEGYKHNLWEDNVHIYAVNEIPYCYDNELKNTTFRDTLDHLVAEDKVWPFLLFIDGICIQWSKITIIHDYDYSYLRIDDITPNESFYAKMVVFPIGSKKIRYGEDRNVLVTPDRKGFYFGMDGKRLESTDFIDISIRLEILDPNIFYKEVNLNEMTSNTLSFDNLPDGYIPTLDNILTFTNDGSFNSLGPGEKIEDIYHGSYGLFNVKNVNFDAKWAILMYNMKDSTAKESSFLFSKSDLSRKAILKLLLENPKDTSSEIWDEVITPLIQTFDFDHKFGESYEKNVDEATKYITRYDFKLWKDVFKNSTNIKSFAYTGLDFKNLADDKGFVHFSRRHSDVIQDVVIMFVNHKLYQYMIDVTYTTNTINLPIFGINNDDHVEILMFTEANNNILTLKVMEEGSTVYIHPEYNLEDCYIMSEECPDAVYDTPDSLEGRKQYIVERTYTVDSEGNYKIYFENDFYYGKDLKIVPKNQFRYYRFKQRDGQYKIVLPTQFNYCHDPDHYLVFINGKKIDRTEYTVTIMNKDRPFDRLILYISTILDAGDYIDIFYIPEVLVEKYKKDQIPKSGLLLLEDEDGNINYPNTYPLSKDTSLVFVNGLKVNPLDIKDVSLNSILFDVDKYVRDENGEITYDGQGNPITKPYYVDSIDNITIMEYVTGDKTVAGYLEGLYEQIPEGTKYDPELIDFNKSASDAWKNLIKTLLDKYGKEGLEKIFGSIFEIEEPAENYKDNFADLRSILYDAVIDFYLQRGDVDTGSPFVYDFERSHFEPDVEPDSTDVTKIIPLYPDKDKLLDYELTSNVAEEKDVKEGKKFYSADE